MYDISLTTILWHSHRQKSKIDKVIGLFTNKQYNYEKQKPWNTTHYCASMSSAYKAQANRIMKNDLDKRPPFINNLEKYSRKTAAQEMLEQIEALRAKRIVAKPSKLEVTYDSQDGKYKKTSANEQAARTEEQSLFAKQIEITKQSKQDNYDFYVKTLAASFLDELQTDFQRAQLLEDVFNEDERRELNERFDEERLAFQDFIREQRRDFDVYEATKEDHLIKLEDGATRRDREERKQRREEEKRLKQIQYEMEEALKKSQEAIKQRAQKQKEIKQRLKQM